MMQADNNTTLRAGKSTLKKLPVTKPIPEYDDESSADDLALKKVTSRVTATRQAQNFVSEHGHDFHPAFSDQSSKKESHTEQLPATPYEAQRATLNHNRSARLRKSGVTFPDPFS